MSYVSSDDKPLRCMAADVQEVIKPFIENEDEVVEIMRLLSGLGASVLLSSGLGRSSSTAQELRNSIQLLRNKFTEDAKSDTGAKPFTVGQASAAKPKPPVRRTGQRRGPSKPDHTWRDGDPYVFHAPRKDGKPEQLPVPTDPQIRERYPWWWAALAPPEEDDDPAPASQRHAVSSGGPSASTGPDFQFSSTSLGTRTRAYLEEELSRPLSVSGLSDVLEQSGTSGSTYRTAAEVERSRASHGGGWRLDLDPAEFNETRSTSKSSSMVSMTPSDLEDETMVAEMVPAGSHSSSRSSCTNVEAESLMEIIDNWQKELRDLRYAAGRRKVIQAAPPPTQGMRRSSGGSAGAASTTTRSATSYATTIADKTEAASGVLLAPLTKHELIALRQEGVDREGKVGGMDRIRGVTERSEALSGLRGDVAALKELFDESRSAREKQRLLMEQRHQLEKDKLDETQKLLKSSTEDNHRELRRSYKDTLVVGRDKLRVEWSKLVKESNEEEWKGLLDGIQKRVDVVGDGIKEEAEARRRHIDGSVGEVLTERIEQLRVQISEAISDRKRSEENWELMRQRLFKEAREALETEAGAREQTLCGLGMRDTVQRRNNREKHGRDEEKWMEAMGGVVEGINKELNDRVEREGRVVENLDSFLVQFERNTRDNIMKQRREQAEDIAEEERIMAKLGELKVDDDSRHDTLSPTSCVRMLLLGVCGREGGNVLTPLAMRHQQYRYRHFLTPGLHRRWNFRSFPHIGEAIRFARASKKIPVSKLMHATLIPERRLLQIQNGMVKPHLFELQVLERYLGVPFYDKNRKSFIDRAV
ncbi:hypothetical protein FOL47_001282 [Perkinsus chesapeaki]|uniref:Uncharacterized protein n=1 Tax=Perkinsus chesapeaki TaxID=330153 RepID=A0A7J6N1J6_PERCH|nr:hypothetical protein FOL47_001282 [Perkinsus chesapeaki]